jgi:hypothetical protein
MVMPVIIRPVNPLNQSIIIDRVPRHSSNGIDE